MTTNTGRIAAFGIFMAIVFALLASLGSRLFRNVFYNDNEAQSFDHPSTPPQWVDSQPKQPPMDPSPPHNFESMAMRQGSNSPPVKPSPESHVNATATSFSSASSTSTSTHTLPPAPEKTHTSLHTPLPISRHTAPPNQLPMDSNTNSLGDMLSSSVRDVMSAIATDTVRGVLKDTVKDVFGDTVRDAMAAMGLNGGYDGGQLDAIFSNDDDNYSDADHDSDGKNMATSTATNRNTGTGTRTGASKATAASNQQRNGDQTPHKHQQEQQPPRQSPQPTKQQYQQQQQRRQQPQQQPQRGERGASTDTKKKAVRVRQEANPPVGVQDTIRAPVRVRHTAGVPEKTSGSDGGGTSSGGSGSGIRVQKQQHQQHGDKKNRRHGRRRVRSHSTRTGTDTSTGTKVGTGTGGKKQVPEKHSVLYPSTGTRAGSSVGKRADQDKSAGKYTDKDGNMRAGVVKDHYHGGKHKDKKKRRKRLYVEKTTNEDGKGDVHKTPKHMSSGKGKSMGKYKNQAHKGKRRDRVKDKARRQSHTYTLSLQRCSRASPWTIHGLWPSNTKCNKNYDESAVAPIKAELREKWPSCQNFKNSRFWKHEFEKHCVRDMSQLEYFVHTLRLRDKLHHLCDIPDSKKKIAKNGECRIRLNKHFEVV